MPSSLAALNKSSRALAASLRKVHSVPFVLTLTVVRSDGTYVSSSLCFLFTRSRILFVSLKRVSVSGSTSGLGVSFFSSSFLSSVVVTTGSFSGFKKSFLIKVLPIKVVIIRNMSSAATASFFVI